MKKDIVIVGSGCSILGSGLGAKIDSVEHVARFGGSEIHLEKNKEDIGVKTTHLFHSCNRIALGKLLSRLNSNIEFYRGMSITFTFDYKVGGYKIMLPKVKKLLDREDINYSVKSTPVAFRQFKNESLLKLSNRKVNRKPTAGLFCILQCIIDCYDNIYLCGFDALCGDVSNLKNPQHFYGGSCELGRLHDIQQEAKIIKHLMETRDSMHILEGQ